MDDAKMRLFVLHAPAGYGKTILINSYMRLAETPGVWYQLGKGDNDVTTFLEYLTAAVRCVFPDFAPGCSHSVQEAVYAFVKALEMEKPQHLNIFFDDYQEIYASEIDELMAFLINHAPEGIRFFLTTKGRIPSFAMRFILRDEASVLTSKQLPFTLDETGELLGQISGRMIDPETTALVYDYTQGWPAGVRFLGLYLREEKNELNRDTIASACREYRVDDFIMHELFKRLPYQIQNYLKCTSPLDYMTAALCNAVLGVHDMGGVLDYLVQEGIFTQKIKGKRDTYRYHLLFKNFLLEQISLADQKQILGRAARVLLNTSQKELGIEYAIRAGEYELAETAIGRFGSLFFEEEKWNLLARWIDFLRTREDEIGVSNWLLIGKYEILWKQEEQGRECFVKAYELALQQRIEPAFYAATELLSEYFLRREETESAELTVEQAIEDWGKPHSRMWFLLVFRKAQVYLINGREQAAKRQLLDLAEHTEAGMRFRSREVLEIKERAKQLFDILTETDMKHLALFYDGEKTEQLNRLVAALRLMEAEQYEFLEGRCSGLIEKLDSFSGTVCGESLSALLGYWLCRTGKWSEGRRYLIRGMSFLLKGRFDRLNVSPSVKISMGQFYSLLKGGYLDLERRRPLFACCFGNFRIFDIETGENVRWRTHKAQECIAYLIHMRGKAVSRDALINILWSGDDEPDKLILMLHNILSSIRKSLEPFGGRNILCSQNGQYWIDTSCICTELSLMDPIIESIRTGNQWNITNYAWIMEIFADREYMQDIDSSWCEESKYYYQRCLCDGMYQAGLYFMTQKEYDRADQMLKKAQEFFPCDEKIARMLEKCTEKSKGDE